MTWQSQTTEINSIPDSQYFEIASLLPVARNDVLLLRPHSEERRGTFAIARNNEGVTWQSQITEIKSIPDSQYLEIASQLLVARNDVLVIRPHCEE